MNILVCIKQVPASNKVEVDSVTGVLKREGAQSKLNPYDLYALEAALRLRERHGGRVAVLSMGPPQAETIIREAYAMGADEGALISDRRFGGADVLATSYTLAQGAKRMGDFDLILCGKQTTDGDTAQVGPEIAEFLNIPHATNVTAISDFSGGTLTAQVDLPTTEETIRMPLPCLISVNKGIHTPRLPSFKLKKATRARKIKVLTLDDLPDANPAHYGLNGSPTQVVRIFPPEHHVTRETWEGSGDELAGRLGRYLQEGKFLN